MLLDFLLPIYCYGCGKKSTYLCNKCLKKIPFLKYQKCPRCNKLSFQGLVHPKCQSQTNLSGRISLFGYYSLVGKLIRDYKYQPAEKINSALIKLTIYGVQSKPNLLSFWREDDFTFLPLPLFPLKKLARGFDQSKEVLKAATSRLGLACSDQVLIRKKWTKQQAKLDELERKRNVKFAFALNEKANLKAGNYVIFDDVWTTGATIKAAASVLKSGGADKIWALTICG